MREVSILDEDLVIRKKEVPERFLTKRLEDGRKLLFYDCEYAIPIGAVAKIKGEHNSTGVYFVKSERRIFKVVNSRVADEYVERKFRQRGKTELSIYSSRLYGMRLEDHVVIDGEIAPSGVYKIGWLKKVKVENGKISKIL